MKRVLTAKPVFRFKRWAKRSYAAFASLHREVTIGVLAVGMSILLPATEAAFAQTDTLLIFGNTRIEEVEVVGTKHSPTRSILPQTPLFDRSVDAAAPFTSMEEALRHNSAIDVRERGGKGMQADISIRGGSFDQTMVMLNGINFTDARTGHQSHSLPIDAECIAEIDLVSGISGVGAYAGAVNIRTKPLYPTYLRLAAECGQHGYFYSNVSGAISRDRLSVFAAGSLRRSDGYTYNTDFRNANGYVRATYDAGKGGFFDFQAGVQGRRFGSNGFYAAYNRDQFEQTSTALGSLRYVKEFERFRVTAAVSYRKNFDRYEWLRGTPTNYHNTDNAGAEVWSDYGWCGGTTTLGGDYIYHHIFSTNLGERMAAPRGHYLCSKSRHVGNLWLRHVKMWRHFEAAGSVGVSFTPYGTSALWSIAGSYRSEKGLRVEIGAEQSMRLPTFTDLYYSSAAQINNPDLMPERAVTAHVGGGYSHGKWSASAYIFYRDGRDVIDWVWREELILNGEKVFNKWHSEQESHIGTFGTEVSGGYSSAEGIVRRAVISYSYLTKSQLRDIKTSSVFDYMRHKLSAMVEIYPVKPFSISFIGTLFDRYGAYTDYLRDENGNLRYDDEGRMVTAQRDFKPYFLLDARLRYEIGAVALHLDFANITNTKYCDFGGLRRPGFWLTGGITLTIK